MKAVWLLFVFGLLTSVGYAQIAVPSIVPFPTALPSGVTPSIKANLSYITNNGAPTVITNFLNGYQGETLQIFCADSNNSVSMSSPNITINSAWICPISGSLNLTLIGSVWTETGRAANGFNPASPGCIGCTTPAAGIFTSVTGSSLSVSGTSTLQAGSASGTFNFNGPTVFNNSMLTQCQASGPILAFNTTSAPSVYSTGLWTDCTNGYLRFNTLGTELFDITNLGPLVTNGTTLLFNNSSNSPDLELYHAAVGSSSALAIGWEGANAFASFEGASFINVGITGGATFTSNGCSATALISGGSIGKFVSGTSGTCAVTISIGAGFITAPNGWYCGVNDLTTPTDIVHQVTGAGDTTTSVMFSGTTVSGDLIKFGCFGY